MSQPRPCPPEELLIGFVDGSVDASEREQTRDHIETCSDCRAASSALAKLLSPVGPAQSLLDAEPNALGSGQYKDTVKTPFLERPQAAERIIGKYRLSRLLGKGGMGEVYLGEHQLLGRTAAVKLLSKQLSDDRESLARFFREAVATSQIKHPGLVHVYDYGQTEDGIAFLVMELLVGETLKERLARCDVLSARDTAIFGAQIAGVLAAAHAHGIVHRDLKPANIIVVADEDMANGERAKVLDFGIAKLADRDDGETGLTATGAIVGTPVFMSPEQCQSKSDVGSPSDVYSLGCLLYRLLAGQPPFVCRTVGELIVAHCTEEPKPLETSDPVVAALGALISRMMRKSPSERPDADSVRAALETVDFDAVSSPAGLEQNLLETMDSHITEPRATPVSTLFGPGVVVNPSPVPPPMVMPQVLSHGEALSPPKRRSTKALWIALSAGIVVVGLALMAILNNDDSSDSGASTDVPIATADGSESDQPTSENQLANEDQSLTTSNLDAAPNTTAPPAAEIIEVVVQSRPDGASVRLQANGDSIGVTPFVLEREAAEFPITLWLSRSGYRTKKVSVSTEHNQAFKLRRRLVKDPLDKM